MTVPVEAGKFYVDGKGIERRVALAEPIEIGLFTADPSAGAGPFSRRDVVRMELRRVRSGRQLLRFVTDRKPTHAGIDPYNLYIDRNSGDNVGAVTS